MNGFKHLFHAEAMLNTKERLALTHAAHSLAPGSIIIDLGTSSGGSANILHAAAPECQVFTIDISNKINQKLFGMPRLNIFLGNIEQFFVQHPDLAVDMVLIDASHYFFDVVQDFSILAPHMKNGSTIAFHDCIGPRFSSVMVLSKTLTDNGNIENPALFDSLLIGEFKPVPIPEAPLFVQNMEQLAAMLNVWLPASQGFWEEDIQVFTNMLEKIRIDAIDAPWIIGRGKRGRRFAKFFNIDPENLIDSEDIHTGKSPCIVCSHYFEEIKHYLISEKSCYWGNIMDSLHLMQYGFYWDLAHNHGASSQALAETAMEIEIMKELACLPRKALKRLYVFGCFEMLLESLYVR